MARKFSEYMTTRNEKDAKRPHLFFSCIALDSHVCPAQGQKIHQNDHFEPERASNQSIDKSY